MLFSDNLPQKYIKIDIKQIHISQESERTGFEEKTFP